MYVKFVYQILKPPATIRINKYNNPTEKHVALLEKESAS